MTLSDDVTDWNERLLDASVEGDIEELVFALDNGADINTKDENGYCAIVRAMQNDNAHIVETLLQCGADVDDRDTHGDTPLGAAVCLRSQHFVNLLISAGADVNARNNDGETPLFWALRRRDPDITKILVDAGADVNARAYVNVSDGNGKTPLMVVVSRYAEDMETLENAGIDIRAVDRDILARCLRIFCSHNRDIARILIDAGAYVDASDVNACASCDTDNDTLLSIIQRSNTEIIELLRGGTTHADGHDTDTTLECEISSSSDSEETSSYMKCPTNGW